MSLDSVLNYKNEKKNNESHVNEFNIFLEEEIKKTFTIDFFKNIRIKNQRSVLHILEKQYIPQNNYTGYVIQVLENMYPNNPFGVKCIIINSQKLAIRLSW